MGLALVDSVLNGSAERQSADISAWDKTGGLFDLDRRKRNLTWFCSVL